jgi:hypothetical protein
MTGRTFFLYFFAAHLIFSAGPLVGLWRGFQIWGKKGTK